MTTATYKNIMAFCSDEGTPIAFHSANMEVAHISEDAWQAIQRPQLANVEALQDLDEWSAEHSQDVKDLPSDTKVRSFSINIAQVCNLQCVYCGADGDGSYGSKTAKIDTSKALEQVRFFISQLQNNESMHLRFIGGEPLLYPSVVKEICRYTKLLTMGQNLSITYSIITNGTLITPKAAELLGQYNFDVTVSIDGTQEVNDKVRPLKSGRGGSTALTMRGLKELSQVRSQLKGIKINCVFGDHNTDIISAYLKFRDLDVDTLNFNYAANDHDETFSSEYLQQMKKVAQLAFDFGGLNEVKRIIQFKNNIDLIETKTRKWNHCGAGKSLLQSDTKGDLYVCNWFMNDPSEKVGSQTEIEESRLKPYQKNLIELHNCQSCWARHFCGGGCMFVNKTKTGDKHTSDLSFCERKRALSALSIHYFIKNLSHNLKTTTTKQQSILGFEIDSKQTQPESLAANSGVTHEAR